MLLNRLFGDFLFDVKFVTGELEKSRLFNDDSLLRTAFFDNFFISNLPKLDFTFLLEFLVLIMQDLGVLFGESKLGLLMSLILIILGP